jgi:hypothetical protein
MHISHPGLSMTVYELVYYEFIDAHMDARTISYFAQVM